MITFATVIILFTYGNINDFHLFEVEQNSSPEIERQIRVHTFIHVLLLTAFNGYFIVSKNKKLTELFIAQERSQWHITVLKSKIKERSSTHPIEQLVKLAMEDDSSFLPLFKKIFPEFHVNLIALKPEISTEELKFWAMLKLGFSTKEIAAYTNLAVRTIQTRKNRLRKSLQIPSETDLYLWIDNL